MSPSSEVHDAPLEQLDPALRELIERLPRETGVYLLKDRTQAVIYVGKAKDLHARVRSYFARSRSDERAFVPRLGQLLGDVETIVTRNEKEALLLENNLIKKHRPRFNVMLRDDKAFLVLRLDPRAHYPRLEVVRRIADDGARYFGPYHSASSCRETLRVVNRQFQLRTCTDRTLRSRTRPCLQYQIGRCPAPCVFDVDAQQYARQVEDVTLFLRGRSDELLARLEQRMAQAAEAENFELAAHLRDQLAAIRRSLLGQQVVGERLLDQDVFALHREGDLVDIAVLNLRAGRLIGQRCFSFSGQEFPDAELLSSFVSLYYDRGQQVPELVLVGTPLDDRLAKAEWLSELRGRKVELLVPRRGDRLRLLELARRNAEINFRTRRRTSDDAEAALLKLQQRLRLRQLPRRIECYDISHLSGRHVVGAMTVMKNGLLARESYRHFKIATDELAANDDFAALYQVLARRLRRARLGHAGWELGDLLVIDGGKGQLAVALAAIKDAGLAKDAQPQVVALAKERESTARKASASPLDAERPDRVFLPQVKDPIRLRPNTAELFLLARLRDEAHRFAITHHRALRGRQALRSSLDDIAGIGQTRKRNLLRTLGSLRRIRGASLQELAAVPGMTLQAAEAVATYFASHPDEEPGGH